MSDIDNGDIDNWKDYRDKTEKGMQDVHVFYIEYPKNQEVKKSTLSIRDKRGE